MRALDAAVWIFSEGVREEWTWVHAQRSAQALAGLKAVKEGYRKLAPAAVRARGYEAGLDFILDTPGAARDRLLGEPTLDYWLYLWEKHFRLPCDEDTWHLHLGLLQGLAATLALKEKRRASFQTLLDPDGHFHFYGLPVHLSFPPEMALQPLRLAVDGKGVAVSGDDGLAFKISAQALLSPRAGGASCGPARLVSCPEILPGLRVETCGLLTVQGVVMHGLGNPSPRELSRFCAVLRTAFEHIADRDLGLYEEMTDLVRVLVPLVNPKDYGSVSSSYVNMRGTIALSHSDDPLLQAETLIHEFCHQKMNQLLLVDPILRPGQSGQVFYSPWRPDARRLRGLILGAHAFLNVSRYLMRSLSRENYGLKDKIAIMGNVARRLYEVEQAVRAACAHGDFTEFGSRFILELARDTAVLFHGAQWFPPALMAEARGVCEAHRRKHGLPLTHFHRAEGFKPGVKPIPFGEPAAPLLYKGKKKK